MADGDRASLLSVHLSPEDHEWLAELAKDQGVTVQALIEQAVQHFRYWQEEGEETLNEALDIFQAERSGHENERRQRLYFEQQLQSQSRRLHDMLRDERNRRAESEKQLRGDRDDVGRQAMAAAADQDGPYDPRVATLLALAIYSESGSEATAAFAKARALHRRKRDSVSGHR